MLPEPRERHFQRMLPVQREVDVDFPFLLRLQTPIIHRDAPGRIIATKTVNERQGLTFSDGKFFLCG